jgi:hypothetical protein
MGKKERKKRGEQSSGNSYSCMVAWWASFVGETCQNLATSVPCLFFPKCLHNFEWSCVIACEVLIVGWYKCHRFC